MARDDDKGGEGMGGATPLKRVAERAGVSIATVSRVVNGVANKASPETVERVRRAVAELGYRPMSAGRSLRRRQSRMVALMASNLANPTMAAIAAAAETALRRAGLVMMLCDSHDQPGIQDEYLLEMRAQMARATVLLGAVDSPGLTRMRAEGAPLLFVNRECPGEADAPFVGVDNAAAAMEVAEALVARGRAPLALIHGPLRSSATTQRVEAFASRATALGAPPAILGEGLGDEHLEIGYRATDAMLRIGPPPLGLFCTSDLIAFGAHRRFCEAGLTATGDVAVVGFDDNPLNPWVAPWLSSVKAPYEAFGGAIVEALMSMATGGRPRLVLPHRLVWRS